jgi:hypothetical protein
LSVEILTEDPAAERFILFYKPSLERLGITVTVRTVDDPQYENRLRSWDFDMIVGVWPESLSPGNEQRDFWGSPAADTPGSRNYVGIKNPAVDALIERVIFAKDRAELVAATRALDRVLLWNFYVVPQFTSDKSRTARWDRFGRPEPLPTYGAAAFPTVWWWTPRRPPRPKRASDQSQRGDAPRYAPSVRAPSPWSWRGLLSGGPGITLSAFGDLKYPTDFKHSSTSPRMRRSVFSHVGSTRAFNQNFLTFNSLNSFILKGDGAWAWS